MRILNARVRVKKTQDNGIISGYYYDMKLADNVFYIKLDKDQLSEYEMRGSEFDILPREHDSHEGEDYLWL